MFNNTINTHAWERAPFPLVLTPSSFPSPSLIQFLSYSLTLSHTRIHTHTLSLPFALWRVPGTPYSPARFPAITMMTMTTLSLSPFLSLLISVCLFSSPPLVPLPPTLLLWFRNDDTALSSFAIYRRFFLPFPNALSSPYRTDAPRSIRKMHSLITRGCSLS